MVRDPGIEGASVSAIWNQPMWPTSDWVSPSHYAYWPVDTLREMVYLLEKTPATIFNLDVMYAKELGFWTTWFFPKQPDTLYLGQVNITMRVFDATPTVEMPPEFDTLQHHQLDASWPGERLIRGFLGVLAAIFHLGPGFRDQRAPQMPQTGAFVINQLTINFKDAGLSDQPHPSLFVSNRCHDGEVSTNVDVSKSPQVRLGALLHRMLDRVLDLHRDDERAPVGRMLYENVMYTIKFMVD